MRTWQTDKRWSDRFVPEITHILGEHLIMTAPLMEDQQHNTDLMVFRLEAVRIACRIRTPNYLTNAEFTQQFTVRADRPGGVMTELRKILDGWGHYLFYGFADPTETTLAAWHLLDLRAFADWYLEECAVGIKAPGELRANKDGSSKFRAFPLTDLPAACLIARKTVDRGVVVSFTDAARRAEAVQRASPPGGLIQRRG